MSKARPLALALALLAVLALVVGVVSVVAILHPGRGAVPMTAASRTSATAAPDPAATVTDAPPGPAHPSPSPSALADIRGLPTHITITDHGSTLIDAEVVPVTLDRDGVLAPPTGKAGVYYSAHEWNTIPGNLDTYRGIIVGHDVTAAGTKDTFYNLGKVRKGDRITLTYRLTGGGTTTAEFAVRADAESAPKADVVHAAKYRYLWHAMPKPERELSVLSCDLSTAVPGQHARNNWIVDAVRVG